MGVAKFKDPSTGKFIKQKVSYIEKVHVGADEPTDPNCNVWIKEVDETSDEYMPSKGEVAEMIAEGTSADSNMLGGKSADSYALQSNVDTIQTTHILNLKTSGWYRVAEFASSSLTALRGSGSNCCKLIIKRAYGTSKPEYHELELTSSYINDQTIKSLSSKCGVQCFTKARYVIDETNLKAYLELYYNVSTDNRVQISVSNSKVFELHWKTITPTLTEETVDGCTVTCTYDIPSSVSTLTDERMYTGIGLKEYTVNTQEELDAILNKYDYPIPSIVRYDINVAKDGLSLTGGKYYVEQICSHTNYQAQKITRYAASAKLICKMRSLTNKVWLDWEDILYQTNALKPSNFPSSVADGDVVAMKSDLSHLSNPNLLINGDFRVNQRNGYYTPIGISYYNDSACTDLAGTTQVLNNVTYINDTCCQYANGQYSKTSDCKKGYVGGGYGLDCWNSTGTTTTITVLSKGINVVSSNWSVLQQKVEKCEALSGKVVTLSTYIKNLSGKMRIAIDGYSGYDLKEGLNVFTLTLKEDTTNIVINFFNNGTSINADVEYVKLELGNVATPLSPRPYGEELALCQRYLWLVPYNGVMFRATEIFSNYLTFEIPLPTSMNNTTTLIGEQDVGILIRKVNSSDNETGFTTKVLRVVNNIATITATKTNHGLTDGVLYLLTGCGISAEL